MISMQAVCFLCPWWRCGVSEGQPYFPRVRAGGFDTLPLQTWFDELEDENVVTKERLTVGCIELGNKTLHAVARDVGLEMLP